MMTLVLTVLSILSAIGSVVYVVLMVVHAMVKIIATHSDLGPTGLRSR
jgi:hypothetical protein